MPFARHDVEQAVWDSMGKGGIQNSRNRFITGDYTAENTRTSSWRSTYSRDRLKLDVLIRKVARRFAAENCTIVVCRMLMQPTSYGSISLSGLQYLENRYVVIQNGQNGPLPDLGQTTTISCYLEVERQNTRAGVHPPGILKNYEINAWTNLVADRAQILENLLLERATC
ncbi:hypothetical protein PHMEG_00022271 [Phytophthora megakarya]|uniref:Uncharacterized protein n=1 Tax=Phytophthora megakarya TaxID=4795 RepID=A0A225VJ70_9STRA|nr:hypothetical protein PHMEG_00022271 [Phytophthora megakarya]